MGRSRKNGYSIFDDLFVLLMVVPIWVGPMLAGITYALFRWIVPACVGKQDDSDIVGKTISSIIFPLAIASAP